MYEPPESAPPPPAFPPHPPDGVPPQPGYPSAPGQPVYGPLPAARASRARLWVALGLVGALFLGGGAYALSSGTGDGKPPSSAAGDEEPLSSGVGGGKPLLQLDLPDTFLGLSRDDDNETAQDMRQMFQSVTPGPGERFTITGYIDDELGASLVTVLAFEQDSAFSAQDRKAMLDSAWTTVDQPDMSISHGPVSDSDPGPLGGALQCTQVFTKTAVADAFGNTLSGSVQCVWIDTNTMVRVIFVGVADQSVAEGADTTRRFRAVAESRR